MFKCEYCGKVLKTETGFQKHMCEKKKRIFNFNYGAFNCYIDYMCFSRTRISKDPEKQKLTFVNSPLYKTFVTVNEYLKTIDTLFPHQYIQWLANNMIESKKWDDDHTYHCFLYDYLHNEEQERAIQRSEEFLKKINETLETISPYDLYVALYNGKISYKYIQYLNFDYVNKIDIVLSSTELNQLKFFLEC